MTLLLVVLLGFFGTVAFIGSRVAVSLLAIQTGSGPADIGLLFFLYSVAQVLLGVATGRWIDRVGLVLPGVVCALATMAGLGAVYAAPSWWTLVFCSIATGSMMMYCITGLNAAAGELGDPARRSASIAWYMFGNSAALGIGPVLTGFGVDLYGARAVFGLIALVPGILILCLWLGRARLVRPPRERPAAGEGAIALALSAPVRPALIVSLFGPLVYEMYTFFVPILGSAAGLSASQIGIALGTTAAVSVATRAVLPRIVRWLREWTVAWTTYLVSGSAFLALGWAASLPPLVVIATVIGVSHGIGNPVMMVLFHNSLPRDRQAEMYGLRGVLSTGALGGSPLIAGALSTVLGAIPVLGLVTGGCYVLAVYARRHGRARTA